MSLQSACSFQIPDTPDPVAPPPLVYGVPLVVGYLTNVLLPLPITGHPVRVWGGGVLLALGVLLWGMPLFFFLSGAATSFSLRKGTVSTFSQHRVRRLLPPLLFGILVVVPPQVYVERVTRGQFEGSFPDFYPHYFDGWYLTTVATATSPGWACISGISSTCSC